MFCSHAPGCHTACRETAGLGLRLGERPQRGSDGSECRGFMLQFAHKPEAETFMKSPSFHKTPQRTVVGMSPFTRLFEYGQGRWRYPGVGLPSNEEGVGTAWAPTGSCTFWKGCSAAARVPSFHTSQIKCKAKTSETIA